MNMMVPNQGWGYSAYPAQPMPVAGYGAYPYQGGYGGSAGITEASSVSPPVPSRLINGVTAYFQQMPGQQHSQLSIMLPFSPTQPGARAIIGDLLTQGSEATKAFLTQCSARGINLGVSPVGEKLQLAVSGPTGQEAEMLQVAMQVLTRPMVDNPSFNKLKENMLKSVEELYANPSFELQEKVQAGFYGKNHPFSVTGKEIMADLSRQTLSSVMASYQQSMQAVGQSKLMMVSSQPIEAQQALVNQHVQQAGWTPNPYQPSNIPVSPTVPQYRGLKAPLLVANDSAPRAYILEAFRAPSLSDPDYPAFCMLYEMLNGMSGHFFKTLRTQKGLVYSTQQSYSSRQKDGASFRINAMVDYDKVKPALEGIQQVVEDMARKPVNEDELRMAKKHYILGLRDAMQSSDGVASLSEPWLINDLGPQHPDVLKAAIERVTPADIQRVARRVFNTTNGYQVIGVTAPQKVLDQLYQGRRPATPPA
jgi:zinc protease